MDDFNPNNKLCACKGIRTCCLCETYLDVDRKSVDTGQPINVYTFCVDCNQAWENADKHGQHRGAHIELQGVTVMKDFVTEDEELGIISTIDKTPWTESQSGRRKQDYGPKVNFKRKKIKMSVFTGLPPFSKALCDKLQNYPCMKNFYPVELCNLEYNPERGSAIDPHFDDFWLWGERLVTINLLSDTFYTMTRDDMPALHVKIPFPRRSAIVLSGSARHTWKHALLREDITSRRLGITIRELTPEFLEGGEQESLGSKLINIATKFEGVAVGTIASGI